MGDDYKLVGKLLSVMKRQYEDESYLKVNRLSRATEFDTFCMFYNKSDKSFVVKKNHGPYQKMGLEYLLIPNNLKDLKASSFDGDFFDGFEEKIEEAIFPGNFELYSRELENLLKSWRRKDVQTKRHLMGEYLKKHSLYEKKVSKLNRMKNKLGLI